MRSKYIKKILSGLTAIIMVLIVAITQMDGLGALQTVKAAETIGLTYHSVEHFYYAKLPTTDNKEINPYYNENLITNYRIYDDGYLNDPTNGCDGSVTIIAPEGWVVELSGELSINNVNSNLKIFDGDSTSSSIIGQYSGDGNYDSSYNAIETFRSTGNKMTIKLTTSSSNEEGNGIILYVKLLNVSDVKNITVSNTANGTVVSNKQNTYQYDRVTLTATPATGYLLSDINVIDSNSNVIKTEGFWYLGNGNQIQFEMPDTAVTVTPTFTNATSANDGLYMNMPYSGTVNATIPNGVKSFKLYDDGGKDGNYSDNTDGTVVITAPTGYIIELTGTVTTPKNDGYNLYTALLNVKDSDDSDIIENFTSIESGHTRKIPTITSTGNKLTINFEDKGTTFYAGLDLTVRIIDPDEEYDVVIDADSKGVVEVDKDSAKANEKITVTSRPNQGYFLNEILVNDENGNEVVISGNTWYSYNSTDLAYFYMPAADAVIKPIFTDKLTAGGGLYVNMDMTGKKVVNIPEGVKSFKVYDNGGKDGNYNNGCNGLLELNAPSGAILVVTGTITSEYYNTDFVSVFDGVVTTNVNGIHTGNKVLNEAHSVEDGEPYSIPATYTGQTMTLHFYSNSTSTYSGLDLMVSVIYPGDEFNVDIEAVTGGTVQSNVSTANPGDVVTLTGNPSSDYNLKEVIVTDEVGYIIPAKGGWFSNNIITFVMPNSDVTVTPVFVESSSADLYVNMPTTGTTEVIIPDDVHSFKVYDDGGKDGNHGNDCNGYLKIQAPIGYYLRLSGKIGTRESTDNLTVYDGLSNTSSTLINREYKKDNINALSSGNGILLQFTSDFSVVEEGLNLTVELVPIEYNVTVTNGTASVGDATITSASKGTVVTLTANEAPVGKMFDKWIVNGMTVSDENSAVTTFVMPMAGVTAEATYKDIPSVTVHFDSNGGTGTMEDETFLLGNYVLPECDFVAPEGMQFKAWSIDGVEKAIGDIILVDDNMDIVAVWEDIPVVHICSTTLVDRIEPTFENDGKEAHYKCDGCGSFYEDRECRIKINDIDSWGTIPKLTQDPSDGELDEEVPKDEDIEDGEEPEDGEESEDGEEPEDGDEFGSGSGMENDGESDDVPSNDVNAGDNSKMWIWGVILLCSGIGALIIEHLRKIGLIHSVK